MAIIEIIGGLGNQMFQYAYALALHGRGHDVKLDISSFGDYELHNGYELEDVFSINAQYCTMKEKYSLTYNEKSLITIVKRKIGLDKKTEYIEKENEQFTFSPRLLAIYEKNTYHRGYWQSYKYFQDIEDIIKERFNFPDFTEEANRKLLKTMRSRETVAVHIRRGDYLNHPVLGNICTNKYYQNAISFISKKIEKPLFVIFSDDIAWCRDNLSIDDVFFVDWNTGEKSFRDMQLMSLCDHNIIANSSFSWWGAWLNANPNKIVITPSQWINGLDSLDDLIPKEWIQL